MQCKKNGTLFTVRQSGIIKKDKYYLDFIIFSTSIYKTEKMTNLTTYRTMMLQLYISSNPQLVELCTSFFVDPNMTGGIHPKLQLPSVLITAVPGFKVLSILP